MNSKQRATIISWTIIGYVGAVSVMILWTVMIMTGKPKSPTSSPVPALDVSSITLVEKQLGTREYRASSSAEPVIQFGKAEPFR